jgi:hypothetical protein
MARTWGEPATISTDISFEGFQPNLRGHCFSEKLPLTYIFD